MARPITQKLVAGHVVKASIDSAGLLTAFPLQSDQTYIKAWHAPNANSTPPQRAAIDIPMDGAGRSHGLYTWQWGFDYLTDGQWSYLITNYLTGTTANVSVLDYTDTNTAIYLQAVAIRPTWGNGLERIAGGYRNVLIRFINGVDIT